MTKWHKSTNINKCHPICLFQDWYIIFIRMHFSANFSLKHTEIYELTSTPANFPVWFSKTNLYHNKSYLLSPYTNLPVPLPTFQYEVPWRICIVTRRISSLLIRTYQYPCQLSSMKFHDESVSSQGVSPLLKINLPVPLPTFQSDVPRRICITTSRISSPKPWTISWKCGPYQQKI